MSGSGIRIFLGVFQYAVFPAIILVRRQIYLDASSLHINMRFSFKRHWNFSSAIIFMGVTDI